jgi:acyl carrier protein
MSESVEAKVRRIVAEHLGVGVEELSPEVSFADDLAADSLDLFELTVALEQHTGLELPESVLDHVYTYGDLERLIVPVLVERERRERARGGPPRHVPQPAQQGGRRQVA